MATAVQITRDEMVDFLSAKGFSEIKLPRTREMVMAKVVDNTKGREICLRIYTSIDGNKSRITGSDAIRSVLVTKVDGDVKVIGSDRRVHRVEGWRHNLSNRIDNWRQQLGPACPSCGRATITKHSKRGPFWGCSAFPVCRGSVSVKPVAPKPSSTPAVATEWQMGEVDFSPEETIGGLEARPGLESLVDSMMDGE